MYYNGTTIIRAIHFKLLRATKRGCPFNQCNYKKGSNVYKSIHTTSLRRCASIGIIRNIGNSSMRIFGGDFIRHFLSRSQHAPSKYNPVI